MAVQIDWQHSAVSSLGSEAPQQQNYPAATATSIGEGLRSSVQQHGDDEPCSSKMPLQPHVNDQSLGVSSPAVAQEPSLSAHTPSPCAQTQRQQPHQDLFQSSDPDRSPGLASSSTWARATSTCWAAPLRCSSRHRLAISRTYLRWSPLSSCAGCC